MKEREPLFLGPVGGRGLQLRLSEGLRTRALASPLWSRLLRGDSPGCPLFCLFGRAVNAAGARDAAAVVRATLKERLARRAFSRWRISRALSALVCEG